MKIVLTCWNCGKEHSDVPLNQHPYLCECGGYVVSPSGKIQGKWIIDESTVYGNDCRDGKCQRLRAENERYRKALERIAEVDIPYAPMTDHSVMRFYEQVAREALASTQTEPSGAEGDKNA